MDQSSWIAVGFLVVMVVLAIFFLVAIASLIEFTWVAPRSRRQFARAVSTVLGDSAKPEEQLGAVRDVYSALAARYGRLWTDPYPSVRQALEGLVFLIRTTDPSTLTNQLQVTLDTSALPKIAVMLAAAEKQRPFEGLPEKEATLLTTAMAQVRSSNNPVLEATLREIAGSVGSMDADRRRLRETVRRGHWWTVIGTLGTLGFGAVGIGLTLWLAQPAKVDQPLDSASGNAPKPKTQSSSESDTQH